MLFVFLIVAFAAQAAEPTRAPVLIELFTSEGCSSCPPADKLLEQLDPRAIVLSEHVDYWDHQGWKDPHSSPQFTHRQQNYATHLGVDGVYTPEMVIDGVTEFNGSDSRRALSEIAKALDRRKATVHLARTDAGIQVAIDDAPRSSAVWLALAENTVVSQVSAGENKGSRLHHVAVVLSLKKIGSVKKGESLRKVVESTTHRVVVFLQDSDSGPITGAAVLEP
jgi:hypothetical protein